MTPAKFNTTRFSKVMSHAAYQILEMSTVKMRSLAIYETPMVAYFKQVKPSALLTHCTLAYIRSCGGFAKEVKTTGTVRMVNGKPVYMRSRAMTGAADITAYYKGRAIEFEVKYGEDTQKDSQIIYEQKINAAGVPYHIIKNLDQLIIIFDKFKNTIDESTN